MLKFDEDLEVYTLEVDGVVFTWDEEPQEGYEERAKTAAANYHQHLPEIIKFMLPGLKGMYGDITADEIEAKLGKPGIDLEIGQVSYCEQRFDDMHIFSFEFMDDDFEELENFAIDG